MTRPIPRRTFLLGSALGVAALAARRASAGPSAQPGELILGALQTRQVGSGQLAFYLVAVDPRGKRWRTIELSFHFHGFVPNPLDPGRGVLFEKHGPGSCEIDLRAGKVLRAITTGADRSFYGHGAYSSDGRLLYATETRRDGTGLIAIRDGKTFATLGELPSHGARPHDCHLIDGGATLVVANGGGTLKDGLPPPSVAYVDVKSTKLRERLTFPSPNINAGHLALGRRGELIAISAPRKGLPESSAGGVTIRGTDRRFLTPAAPKEVVARIVGEALSVAVHPASGLAGVTSPDGNLVTFWDLRRRRLVKQLDLEYPRGITLTGDQRHFVISCGRNPRLAYYGSDKLEPVAAREVSNAGLSGSHIYTHHLG